MTILFIASRFHEANPRRGAAVQVLGLIKALRSLGEEVDLLDPFGVQDGGETEQILQQGLASSPIAIVAMGPQRSSWSGWPVLAAHRSAHGVPMICIDVDDPTSKALADVQFSSQMQQEQGVLFMPPATDPDIYHPIRSERDLAFTFVGRLGRLRKQSLSLLRPLPSFMVDSSQDQEARVPRRAMASLLARSVVGLDLIGKRPGAVHGRVFEAIATSSFALAPWSEALCACLDPGREVFAYRDTGEMVEMVQRINNDPQAHSGVLLEGRRRVLSDHTFQSRARTLLDHVRERVAIARVPAAPGQSQPKVTIFMPVYGAEDWVGPTVDSLLGQTWQNLEVVAVHDGSRDRSAEILRAKAAGDPRLRLIDFETNRGEAVRRNDALAAITEDTVYVSNHDADDLSDPRRIERQVAYLEANPQVHCVGSQARILDRHGNLRDYLRVATDPDEIDNTFHIVNSVIHSSALFRKSVLRRVVGYRNGYRSVDDYEFFARMLECGYRIANLPDVLISRREHSGSISSTLRDRQEVLRQAVAGRLEASLPWRLAQRQARPRLRVHLSGSREGMEGKLLVQGRGVSQTLIWDDFRYLRLPPSSCSELWLSNCLEQLPRAAGMRALMEWHTWLEIDGRMMLETPDLAVIIERAAECKIGQAELLRHLFGDQVGRAVAHRDAYDTERLTELLPRLGFEIEGVGHIDRQGLPFVTVECRKRTVDAEQQAFAALDLLEDFLIDADEVDLRESWHRQLSGEPAMGSSEQPGMGSTECAF